MILRHARTAEIAQNLEDTFEAIDERTGETLGRCEITMQENANLFPNRPVRVYLELDGTPVQDALLGAAIARAKEIAIAAKQPARIFTQIEPDNTAFLEALTVFGFKDSDGLVRMRRRTAAKNESRMLDGCVEVWDDLDDSLEEKFFLERYNQLFNEDNDLEWLDVFRAHTGFKRLLIVSPAGMVGEAAICENEGCGEILWLNTAKKWRRKGVAHHMLNLACAEFEKRGLKFTQADVQARIPGILHVMESAGFSQDSLLMRYPGIDIN